MANYLWLTADHVGAADAAGRALALARAAGDRRLAIEAAMRLGHASWSLGNYERAVELFESVQAEAVGELADARGGLPGPAAVLGRDFLARCLVELGRFDQAIREGEEALRLAEGIGHPFTLVAGLAGLGLAHVQRGDLAHGIALLERGLGICHGSQILVLRPWLTGSLGWAYATAGRAEEAIGQLREAIAEAEAMGHQAAQSLRRGWLAEACLGAGRRDEAGRLLRQALEEARQRQERGHEAWLLRVLAELTGQGPGPDLGAVERHYRQALERAEALGMRPLAARTCLGLAALHRRLGRQADARAAAHRALEDLRAMRMMPWVTQAEAFLAAP